MLQLTEQDFDTTTGTGIVMVDFFADRCGPCQILGKLMPHLSKKYEGKAIVAKVNTDLQPALSIRYNVSGLPTVVVLKDGVEVERLRGLHPPEKYSEVLDEWLGEVKSST